METRVWIVSPLGHPLAAVLADPAVGGRRPVVAFAHGWGSGRGSPRNVAIAHALAERGIASLLLDFSGHGESEGVPGDATVEDQVGDLQAVVDWLALREDLGPIGLAGSSSGAAVALALVAREPRVRAVVLRAPSGDARLADAARVSAPTLLVVGARDPGLRRARDLERAMPGERRLVVVPGAGHLFEEPGAFDLARHETVGWFRRWLARDNGRAGGEAPRPARRGEEPGPPPFQDRAEAGGRLAARLDAWRGPETLVLALPRGGVPVAEPIALALGADLDVLVSCKVRAPSQPELAIGAVAEGEVVLWNDGVLESLRLGKAERREALDAARREIEERVASFRSVAPRVPIRGRPVILVDDGVATGATLRAALAAVAASGAAEIVVALPGGPRETLDEIARAPGVREAVALEVPAAFRAVGQLYAAFEAVSNEEVRAALRRARTRRRAREPAATGGRGVSPADAR